MAATASVTPASSNGARTSRTRIVIVGSGFAGLGMGIRLRQAGIDDFVILERADDLGGTWRDNSYPGCAVDVQSHLYSYSFAPNPDWTHVYSPQAEIWSYIRRCADEFGATAHVRLGCEVTGADWSEDEQHWEIETSTGPLTAQFLISALGPLSERAAPDLDGLESFEGPVFHSAAWDHSQDLHGLRVAVIGTGASAAQFVPRIQPQVARLLVFQRTAPWTWLRLNRRITRAERALYRRYPVLQRLARGRQYVYRETLAFLLQRPNRTSMMEAISRLRLRLQVRDPALRAKLTPGYRMGCKRIIVTDDYVRALAKSNVEVISDGLREIRADSIVTGDGTEHRVDAIILATGFHPISVADPLRGRDGVPLAERWSERRSAYLGTLVSGYHNYFMLIGPNTATGHTSILLYAEEQIELVLRCLHHLEATGSSSIDVRADVQEAFNRELRDRLQGTVWTDGGCTSWYLDPDGGTSIIWPGYTWEFRRALRNFDPSSCELRASGEGARSQSAR